jgi:DNA-directed RNA polymerase specialized sigma24 family protein
MGDFELSSDELMHYGVKRRSGRYPWGSGEHPFQRSGDFLARVEELESDPEFVYIDTKGEWGPKGKEYKGQTGVAHSLGLSSTELRVQKGLAKDERRAIDVATAKSLVYDKGLSKMEAGRRMGINESTVRSLLDEVSESRMKAAKNTADKLREEVESKGTIDISKGVERYLGVSSTKLEEARYILEREGYIFFNSGNSYEHKSSTICFNPFLNLSFHPLDSAGGICLYLNVLGYLSPG